MHILLMKEKKLGGNTSNEKPETRSENEKLIFLNHLTREIICHT